MVLGNKRTWARKSLSPKRAKSSSVGGLGTSSQNAQREDPPIDAQNDSQNQNQIPPPGSGEQVVIPPPTTNLSVNLINSVIDHVRLEEIDLKGISQLKNYYLQQARAGVEVELWNCLSSNVQKFLKMKSEIDLEHLGPEELINELFLMYPEKSEYRESLSIRVQQVFGSWNESNRDIQSYTYKLLALWEEQPPSAEEEPLVMKEVVKTLSRSKIPFQRNVSKILSTMKPFENLGEYVRALDKIVEDTGSAIEYLGFLAPHMFKVTPSERVNVVKMEDPKPSGKGTQKNDNNPSSNKPVTEKKCYGCGEIGHVRPVCPKRVKGNNLLSLESTDLINQVEEVETVNITNITPSLINLNILIIRESIGVTTTVMLDSGSTRSLISRRVANKLNINNLKNNHLCCFANNSCTNCSSHLFNLKIKLSTSNFNLLNSNLIVHNLNKLKLYTGYSKTTKDFEVEFRVMNDMKEDVILSREVIYDNDLTVIFEPLFSKSKAIECGLAKEQEILDNDYDSVSDDEIIICNNVSEVNKEPVRPLFKDSE